MGVVDGHDLGSGEMNVFIHTDVPKVAFEKAKAVLGTAADEKVMRAGYRDFSEDIDLPMYPPGLGHFSVV